MQASKLAIYKRFCQTPFPTSPSIKLQSSIGTWGYTPPKHTIPTINIKDPIELVHDPTIPKNLLNELDGFLRGLPEDRIDDKLLTAAKEALNVAFNRSQFEKIGNESTVLGVFSSTVGLAVKSLCQAIGVPVSYEESGQYMNLRPDHAWYVDDKEIAIFEHKKPKVFNCYVPKIIEMARNGTTLDLSAKIGEAPSIAAKVVLASLAAKHEFCVVHSAEAFVFIRILRDPRTGYRQARVSDIVELTNKETPVISLVLALILPARKGGQAVQYQPAELDEPSSANVDSQEYPDGDWKAPEPGPQGSTGPQDLGFHGGQTEDGSAPRTRFNFPEYWEPKEIPEKMLAYVLNSMDGISITWDLEPFTRDVFRMKRRDDSSLWCTSPGSENFPRLIRIPSNNHDATPPPSPPMTPFALCLNSTMGCGAIGTVYQGQIIGLSTPIVVKILSPAAMDAELKIWRKLRSLSGIGIPGLFGAYLYGDEAEEHGGTGALVQQNAGVTLSTFDRLSLEQK
ncbi:hypothetical protein FRB90_011782 [Tulasnella sp. 427]|nr:hypothetical protein FRB90_011782 [Tulasnella sp. 427]